MLASDADERSVVLLRNSAGDKGCSLRFHRRQLPCFTLWKNTQAQADGYVTGLEPGTSLPNLKTFEREQGRVIDLAPGESYQAEIELAVHDSAEAVAQVEQAIAAIQGDTTATVHRQPVAKFSPGA